MIARCICDGCPGCVDHFPTPGPCSRAIRQPGALCDPCADAPDLTYGPAPTVNDFGAGPVPVWYAFTAEWTPAAGRWPLCVTTCATGPIAAVRKMRRAFPPEPGTRLARLVWNRCAPLTRPHYPVRTLGRTDGYPRLALTP